MRIRTIKPEFFTHEGLFEAEQETGLPVRLAFAGLWCIADREGRFRWEPRRIGVQVLPYDGADFGLILDALAARGFVVKYRQIDACPTRAPRVNDACRDACFGYIPGFLRHQVVNNREALSTLPDPNVENVELLSNPSEFDACPTRAPRVPHASKGEGKGREGKGKEGERKEIASTSDACVSDVGNPMTALDDKPEPRSRFKPPTREELNLEAAKIGLPDSEVDKFVHYYGANGWKVGKSPMKSWTHALAGWATRWRERAGGPNGLFPNRYGTATPADAEF
jgi:hypothetical protein